MRDTLNLYLLDNPIAAAEMLRLRRTQITARRWRRWLNQLVLYAALALSLLLYGGYLWFVLDRPRPLVYDQIPIVWFWDFLGRLPVVLMVITFVWYLVLLLQTLGVASQSITREKAENTWDLVLMTDVTPARLVWGKWLGVVRRQVRPFAMLTVLWLGVISWMSINNVVYPHYRSQDAADVLTTIYPYPVMIVAPVVIGLLMLLNLGLTAACGILGGVLSRHWRGAVAWGIVIRIVVAAVPTGLFLLLVRYTWDREGAWHFIVAGIGNLPLAYSGLSLLLTRRTNAGFAVAYPPLYLPFALGISVLLFVIPGMLLQSLAVWRVTRQ